MALSLMPLVSVPVSVAMMRVVVMRMIVTTAVIGPHHLAREPMNMVMVVVISRQMPHPALAEQGDIAGIDLDIRRMASTADVMV